MTLSSNPVGASGGADAGGKALVDALMASEAEHTVRDMAGHVGDEVHAILKRHGMLMKTTGGAIAVGVLAAAQVLCDALEFARRSMEDDEERQDITAAVAELFVQQVDPRLALCRQPGPIEARGPRP